MTIKAAIFGAGGFVGGELMRLIATHDEIETVAAFSQSSAGEFVWTRHPHLRVVLPNFKFSHPKDITKYSFDLAFVALPHGDSAHTTMELIKRYDKKVKIIDLSADFRLKSAQRYQNWYGIKHPYPELLKDAVYGLPEFHREEIKSAYLVSGVGCNATAVNLALFPIADILEEAHADIRVGSSEAGAQASQGSHHPFRSRALRLYAVGRHRHIAEVSQELNIKEENLSFTITAVELVRGVQAVTYCKLKEEITEQQLWKKYRSSYKNEPFVHLCPAKPQHLRLPDPRWVTGSNHCLLGFLHHSKKQITVVSVLDNLIKGSAGTALRCANIMFGIEETKGLTSTPVFPV